METTIALLLIENDQALYRGPYHNYPTEIWSIKEQKWVPYKGSKPKPGHWGDVITEAEAEAFKRSI